MIVMYDLVICYIIKYTIARDGGESERRGGVRSDRNRSGNGQKRKK